MFCHCRRCLYCRYIFYLVNIPKKFLSILLFAFFFFFDISAKSISWIDRYLRGHAKIRSRMFIASYLTITAYQLHNLSVAKNNFWLYPKDMYLRSKK